MLPFLKPRPRPFVRTAAAPAVSACTHALVARCAVCRAALANPRAIPPGGTLTPSLEAFAAEHRNLGRAVVEVLIEEARHTTVHTVCRCRKEKKEATDAA